MNHANLLSECCRRTLSAALTVIAALSAGCIGGATGGAAGALEFRIIDGAFRTFPEQSVDVVAPLYDQSSDEIRLSIAGNETAGFFLELRSRGWSRLSLHAGPLTSDSGAQDIAALKFYGVRFVEASSLPGWHIKAIDPQRRRGTLLPDLLIPADAPKNGQPYAVSAGEPQFVWVDVSIPKGTRAGHYFGTIRTFEGTRVAAQIPVAVQVLPFDLPEVDPVALLAPVPMQNLLAQHLSVLGRRFAPEHLLRDGSLFEESNALIQGTFAQLRQHRLSPYLTGCYPVTKMDARGEISVRWDDYDAVVGPLLDGPHAARYWPVPLDSTFPKPPEYDPLTSAGYTRTVRQYLTQCAEHFSQRGWNERAFVDLPVGIDYTAAGFERAKGYAEIARLGGQRLKVMSRLPPHDLRRYGWSNYPFVDLSGYVDIWCPAAQFFDAAALARPRSRGAATWMTLDHPPYSGSVDLRADDTFARVIPLQAAQLGAAAVLLPPVTAEATVPAGPGRSRTTTPLLAPGTVCGLKEPIPTLRLKMLRRGMQDLAYLQLCRDAGRQDVADAVTRALSRYAGADAYGIHFTDGRFGGWVRDPTWWNHARNLMISALQGQGSFGSTEWQRFFEATDTVEVRINGTRVQLQNIETGGTPQFNIRTSVTLRNYTRRPLSGTLSFGELPLGWEAVGGPPSLSLHPSARVAVTLKARTPTLPSGEAGKIRLPLDLKLSDQATPRRYWAEVAHISVPRVNKAIRLDGDASDWPPAIGNAVTHFTSISADTSTEAPSKPPDGGSTLGFAAADADHLYLLFHCATPAPYAHDAVLSNFLTYEDGIPVGEEMLEILIDPANAGSTNPADLFHLVIKPSGAVLKERGIRAEPQIGPVRAWTADIQVVTRRERKKWLAEIRIPLASFGTSAAEHFTWGINFCRFDAAGSTYTNWAAARWNTYTPAALGNMTFAR